VSQVTHSSHLNTIELFAGVGGFRLGLEHIHGSPFRVTLSNQFEPARKTQHASNVYRARWSGDVHLNEDIAQVLVSDAGRKAIRDSAPDVVVGGFPCQDYSVAKPLSQSHGIAGKKGVLWWSIAELLKQRLADGMPVKYLILENVDRLVSSPATCHGRDFAMIQSTLYQLGYAVEWRVINAADYGFPQRRRRTFMLAYHESTNVFQNMKRLLRTCASPWFDGSVLKHAFPGKMLTPLNSITPALTVRNDPFHEQVFYKPLPNGKGRFENTGVMLDGEVWTSELFLLKLTITLSSPVIGTL
jgi:DNA (cytosine-5)-methyltransferase 1